MKKGGAWEGRGKGKTSEMQDIFISNVEIDVEGACSQRGGVERRSRGSSPGVLPQRAHSPPRKPGSRAVIKRKTSCKYHKLPSNKNAVAHCGIITTVLRGSSSPAAARQRRWLRESKHTNNTSREKIKNSQRLSAPSFPASR